MAFQKLQFWKILPSVFRAQVVSRSTGSQSTSKSSNEPLQLTENVTKEVEITEAIRNYLTNAKQFENMLVKEQEKFELGRRHLANIMSEDPENFGQEQIDEAISYLFPSSLHPAAKPVMKPPTEIFPKKKRLQCDLNGRPLHTMYYTSLPKYYHLMKEAVYELEVLKMHKDKHASSNKNLSFLDQDEKLTDSIKELVASSEYFSYEELRTDLLENISSNQYKQWLILMDRIINHPYSYLASEFISKYRNKLEATQDKLDLPEPQLDPISGLRYAEAYGQKKWALAEVRLYIGGSGNISINGKNLLRAFKNITDREQLIFPLAFTGLLGKVNIEASVSGSGSASQSNALRLGICRALTCFLGKEEIVRLRLAGLLTQDVRFRERKKPGQPKARKKPTWKAR